MANSAFNHEPAFTIPGSTTDNAVIRWDSTSGGGQLNSGVLIDDSNVVTGITTLQIDNINLNGNTISSTAGTDLLITPLSGQQIVLDGTIIIDAGVVTGVDTITASGVITAGGFTIGSAAITEAELEILDGATVTTTELNLLDALDRGSILYGNASGVTTVLGQGSANQLLTSDGTDIAWQDAAGGTTLSGSTNNTVVTVTGANAMIGEANLTFNGSTLALTGNMTISTDADIDGTLEADAITVELQ